MKYKILNGAIEEGDACICNFRDRALKFWFRPNQLLFAKIVQKLKRTPNRIWFEEVENLENGFYSNSFTKVEPTITKRQMNFIV